jgi:FkbM family methyltransferase
VIRGKQIDLSILIDVPMLRLGSEYGGYWINKESLSQESIVYSVGIGEDFSFDLDLMNEIGCRIFAFDPTPKSIEWVKKQNLPEGIIFTPWGISDFDDEAEFHPPNNPKHVSHSLIQYDGVQPEGVKVTFRRLATIMKHYEHDAIDLLKMDIEGEEYTVIKDIVCSNIQVNQICLEFHHRFSGLGIDCTKEAVEDLKGVGLYLFHQDGNCCSFIRR